MDKFLENQYVLYILCFLGITNLLGFLYVKDYDSMILLIALGIVTSYFSENHSIQLSVALIGTNFIFVNKKVSEGFLNQRKKLLKENFRGRRRRKVKEGMKDTNEAESKKSTNKKMVQTTSDESKDESDDESSDDDTKQGFTGKCKKGETMVDGECTPINKDNFSNKKKIDQSATLKDAYSNISNVLGKGGINSLTKETQELVSQQKDLIKQMSSLGPMIANVSSLAKGMPNMKDMSGLLKGLGNNK